MQIILTLQLCTAVLQGHLPLLAWSTSLLGCSLFSFFVYPQSHPTLWHLFFLSLINFLAMGKSLDSSLDPYQEPRPTGGREGLLDSPANIMNSLEMVIWSVLAPVESKRQKDGSCLCSVYLQCSFLNLSTIKVWTK